MSSSKKPTLHTVLSPALLSCYDLSKSVVVVIDILRATSTIAAALHNGAKEIIPVDSVAECIQLGKKLNAITAGERDGQIAEGLEYGNTPFQYTRDFVEGKTLVLTTTNGTKLLRMAVAANANQVITGAFSNLSAVCNYLIAQNKNVILACSAWKNKVNFEDSLMAGAIINRVQTHFSIECDSSKIAALIYKQAGDHLYDFMKSQNASHYQRLSGFGLKEDLKYCFKIDTAPGVNIFENGRLILLKES